MREERQPWERRRESVTGEKERDKTRKRQRQRRRKKERNMAGHEAGDKFSRRRPGRFSRVPMSLRRAGAGLRSVRVYLFVYYRREGVLGVCERGEGRAGEGYGKGGSQ